MYLYLLLALPTTEKAQAYYGSTAPLKDRKKEDVGVDLPFIEAWTPILDVESKLINLETVFAMYRLSWGADFENTPAQNFEDCLETYFNAEDVRNDSDKQVVKNMFEMADGDTLDGDLVPCPWSLRPRSSIGKGSFRLANTPATIETSFRGIEKLIATYQDLPTDKLKDDTLRLAMDYNTRLGFDSKRNAYFLAGESLIQIVSPDMSPIHFVRFDNTKEDVLFWNNYIGSTSRDGFGSSGK